MIGSHEAGDAVDQHDPDDLDAYISTLSEAEQEDLALAGAAIDIAVFLYRARESRGLSQAAAARLAGLQQQAVSRLEQPDSNPRLDTIQRYLRALGYALEIQAREAGNPRLVGERIASPV